MFTPHITSGRLISNHTCVVTIEMKENVKMTDLNNGNVIILLADNDNDKNI